MPYRSFSRRRRFVPFRRFNRRSRSVFRSRRSRPSFAFKRFKVARANLQRVKYFKRKARLADLTAISSTGSTGSPVTKYTFSISSLPDYTEFTTLFDQWKLTGVQLKFIPQLNQSAVNGSTVIFPTCTLHTVIDYDGGIFSNPSTLNDLLEYDTHRMTMGTRTHTRYFKPKFLASLNPSGYKETNGWIPTDSINVQYNSLYAKIETPNAATSWFPDMIYQVYATYYLAMKSVK